MTKAPISWVGQALVKEILGSNQFTLAGAISRGAAGQDIGNVSGPSACWSDCLVCADKPGMRNKWTRHSG
jgi:hypothetical protein